MININHSYALLGNGTIEPLHYSDGELRDVYQAGDGLWYMDHDVYGTFAGHRCIAYRHDTILATSDIREELEVLTDGKTT